MYISIASIIIGLIAGFLGGQFGVGGGLITTPAIRLILQQKALIAVGTPLPIIIPTAISGFYNYHKNNLVDYKVGLIIGVTGAFFALLGAYVTPLIGGSLILIITAILIAFVSIRYFKPQIATPSSRARNDESTSGTVLIQNRPHQEHPIFFAIITGIIAGFLSGLLGLGGGFVIIPALTIFARKEIKEAFGTSLLAIMFIAIPGTIIHFLLGNINLQITLFMILGVIPGALIGSKVTISLPDKIIRILFGFYLLLNALFLAANEIFLM